MLYSLKAHGRLKARSLQQPACPLSQTVKHPLCVKHPPSVKYVRCFLSELIRKVSSGHCPSRSQTASWTRLLSRSGPSAPACLWELKSILCPFPALQTPIWQGAGSLLVRPVRGSGGQEGRRGQGISPSLPPGVWQQPHLPVRVLIPPRQP